jgi:hypothetical protein
MRKYKPSTVNERGGGKEKHKGMMKKDKASTANEKEGEREN